ncbi:MAG: DUF6526 family protein [Bryobacteraceae bacterium]
MTDRPPQSRDNHARLHPPFHFFFSPLMILLLLAAVYRVIRYPGLESAMSLLLIVAVGTVGFLARTYALKVQDRVIRLEERLRLSTLASADLRPLIDHLSEAQLIALRFASDEEAPTLAERAATEDLNGKAIKAAIKSWRPDYWRV